MIPLKYQETKYEDVPVEIQTLLENIRPNETTIASRRGIYIHGEVGTGKTHIAYALKKKWDENRASKALFWNTNDLMNEIKKDFEKTANDKIRPEEEIMSSKSLLFLDDIGSEKMTEFVAETFYRIINYRYEHMLPVIFTSNFPISDIAERIGDRTASRIVGSCTVVELKGSDKRMEKTEKITILKK